MAFSWDNREKKFCKHYQNVITEPQNFLRSTIYASVLPKLLQAFIRKREILGTLNKKKGLLERTT